jgi:hypothetical protein
MRPLEVNELLSTYCSCSTFGFSELCLVRASGLFLLSVGFGLCINLPAGLPQIEYLATGDQWKLIAVITQACF